MNRRNLLKSSVALGFASAIPTLASGKPSAGPAQTPSAKDHPSAPSNPLVAPASGDVPVAFVISDGAVVIDFCGPWEGSGLRLSPLHCGRIRAAAQGQRGIADRAQLHL